MAAVKPRLIKIDEKVIYTVGIKIEEAISVKILTADEQLRFGLSGSFIYSVSEISKRI